MKEAFLSVDYTFLDHTTRRFSPFIYGDVLVFHFNPYTFDDKGNKLYLQHLSTEGQGLADYPDRKVYNLTQKAIGFGGGFKYIINDNVMISLDAGQRKTFTDYIDDVSKTYVDEKKLFAAKG